MSFALVVEPDTDIKFIAHRKHMINRKGRRARVKHVNGCLYDVLIIAEHQSRQVMDTLKQSMKKGGPPYIVLENLPKSLVAKETQIQKRRKKPFVEKLNSKDETDIFCILNEFSDSLLRMKNSG